MINEIYGKNRIWLDVRMSQGDLDDILNDIVRSKEITLPEDYELDHEIIAERIEDNLPELIREIIKNDIEFAKEFSKRG